MDVPHEILTRYLERRTREIEDCKTYLSNKQFTKIEKVGHQLRGNGVTFGYPELSKLGEWLEKSSHEQDIDSTQEALEELSRWVEDHRLN